TPTTAGSPALLGAQPPDAFIIARLRAAGAVILAKANLSEWANFRSTHSTSGWSTLGGQAANPYALDRNPSGSSSGSAVGVAAAPGRPHGARIGIWRSGSAAASAATLAVLDAAVAQLRTLGAALVDPVELPDVDKIAEPEWAALKYEFKYGINAYLRYLAAYGG